MSNNFNTIKNAPGIIMKAAAGMFVDGLNFDKSVTQADPEDYKGKNGYSAGDTILISLPMRAIVTRGNFDITSNVQDTVEGKAPLVLDISATVGLGADTPEFASQVQLQNYIERVVMPAANSLAQDVEQQKLQKASQMVWNTVGLPGSTVFDTDTVLAGKERLGKFLTPPDKNRRFLVDNTASRSAVNARKGLFNDQEALAKQYQNGVIGRADGFGWLESELLYRHTMGNSVTGVATNAAAVEGASTISVNGLTNTTGTVTKGSVFTLAGVFAVHPITRQVYPFLQQFVVTADALANGSGVATLNISPALYSSASGSLQNISNLPANPSTLTFVGAASSVSTQNLQFHKDAFRSVSVPLIMPKKAEWAEQITYKGHTIAIVRDWDQYKRKMITRLDYLGGIAGARQDWACRVAA